MKQVLLGALLLLPCSLSARLPQAAPGINFFSPQQDLEIGAASAEEAERQLSIVRDTHLNQFLRTIGQRLLTTSLSRQLRYQFRIVNSSDVASFGFPNGAIYVYRGLLEVAANDDQLAAVLAHEIGHITSRHATSQLSRQLLVQAPISISSGLPTDEWKEQLTKLGVVFGVNAPFLHYSPDQEIEAAAVASRLLTAGRFDPAGLDAVFQKAGETVTFLYNHPVPENPNRESEPDKPARPSVQFRSFQAALAKLPKPAPGKEPPVTVEGDSLPNVYSHPLNYYKLNYPDGWQVRQTSTGGAIISAPNGLRTSVSGDDITYGLMLDMFDLSGSEKPLSLEQATNRLIVALRQRNQTVRAVPGAQAPTLIHDQPGLRTVLLRGGLVRSGNSTVTAAQLEQNREPSEVLWLVTRMYYQNLFYMVFVAPEEEFPAHQQMFEQIIRSVQIP